MSRMQESDYKITPANSHKTSSTSLFNSLKRRDSKQSYKGGSGSISSKQKHYQASRPPPGFVSYQIPNGVSPLYSAPSDNIYSYDSRSRYSTSALSLTARNKNQPRDHPTTAGVHPHNLHNNGKSHKQSVKQKTSAPASYNTTAARSYHHHHHHSSQSPPGYDPPPPAAWTDDIQHIYNTTPRTRLNTSDPVTSVYVIDQSENNRIRYTDQSEDSRSRYDQSEDSRSRYDQSEESRTRYTGEGGKKYRKSPVPVLKSPVWVQDVDDIDVESVRTLSSGSPEYYYGKPPLPRQCDMSPKPPPRSRPKSWTSSLFNAFRSSKSSTIQPRARDVSRDRYNTSSMTLSSMNTGNMEKKGFRFTKQVRFLANPNKNLYSTQKFYSLPHFNKPLLQPSEDKTPEPEKMSQKPVKPPRSPSPFGRFVKSLVKSNRGNRCYCCCFNPLLENQKMIVSKGNCLKRILEPDD